MRNRDLRLFFFTDIIRHAFGACQYFLQRVLKTRRSFSVATKAMQTLELTPRSLYPRSTHRDPMNPTREIQKPVATVNTNKTDYSVSKSTGSFSAKLIDYLIILVTKIILTLYHAQNCDNQQISENSCYRAPPSAPKLCLVLTEATEPDKPG